MGLRQAVADGEGQKDKPGTRVSCSLGFLADLELGAHLGVDGMSQTGHSSVTKVHAHRPKGWGGGVLLWAFREENAQSSRETSSSSGCIKEDETGQWAGEGPAV